MKYFFAGVLIFGLLCLGVFFVIPFFFNNQNVLSSQDANKEKKTDIEETPQPPVISHIETPEPLKAIYMSACYAGSKKLREGLVDLIDTTELNALVIDIKDYSGKVSFAPNADWDSFVSNKCSVSDMADFIKTLHEKNIYVIGRITSFQDPYFAKLHPEIAVKRNSDKTILWADKKGINYLDPSAPLTIDHLTKLATDSYDIGFDEINFDYIRFPSDGNMKDIYFPYSEGKNRATVMEDVFKSLSQNLKPKGIVISADLFGMVTTNTDDLNIGQVLERALPYFDYIAPMVYPSHYPPNFNGWKDPNKYPYDLIKFVMSSAVKRTVATTTSVETFDGVYVASSSPRLYTKESFSKLKMRPWLQDFDYGGNYDIPEVKAQIKATYDAGLTSWMLWSPSNRYTVGALEKN